MATIHSAADLLKALQFDSLEELEKFLSGDVYPVTITCSDNGITLAVDADRFPITKALRFPFSDDDYDNAIVGLQCTADYAMHEGYWHTHKDVFEAIAIRYAEQHGIYEYKVNQNYMEYWILYDQGFYFYRIDLNTLERTEVCHLPWTKDEGYPVPAFLLTGVEGYTKYNYFEG